MKTRSIVVIVLLFSLSKTAWTEEFPEDPLNGRSGAFIYNEFMQIDNISPRNLHPAIDVAGANGDSVYPPVSSGSDCKILAIGADNIMLLARNLQSGDYAVVLFHHIVPNTALQTGTWIGRATELGKLDGNAHLHASILLSSDATINDADYRNPRKNAFSSSTWFSDSEMPMIDSMEVHIAPIGAQTVWQIWAHDTNQHAVSGANHYFNGIYQMKLYIDGSVVDSFEFEKYANKAGNGLPSKSEFYHPNSGVASGYNNPNVMQYQLSWTQLFGRHTWRVGWGDANGNYDEGNGTDPPAIPFAQMGGEILDGRARLTWRVESPRDLRLFNVWQSRFPDHEYEKVNLEPIMSRDDQTEYEFLAQLPRDWETIWYRVSAEGKDRTDYLIAQKNFGLSPLITRIQTRPNPSSDRFEIELTLSRQDIVDAAIFDVQGRKVRTIQKGSPLPQGIVHWSWDGANDHGVAAAAGIYILKVNTKQSPERIIHKIVLVR